MTFLSWTGHWTRNLYLASLPVVALAGYHWAYAKPAHQPGWLGELASFYGYLVVVFLLFVLPGWTITFLGSAFLVMDWRRGHRWKVGLAVASGLAVLLVLTQQATTGPRPGHLLLALFLADLAALTTHGLLGILAALGRLARAGLGGEARNP